MKNQEDLLLTQGKDNGYLTQLLTVKFVRRVQILDILKIELTRFVSALDVGSERKGAFRGDSRILA